MLGRFGWAARVTIVAVMGAWGILQAASPAVTIAPTGYITVGLGGAMQFTATVTGLTGGVIWSVGRPGLNSGLGTISTAGLYTAPSVLPANTQIQITATSMASPGVAGITFLYLLPPGPVITAVSPNPQTVGTVKVTITGSGFVAGAMIMDSGVQVGATFVNSTTLTASVYQGPASSASFYVVNPG
jgi:hypothetical protein